MSTHLLLNERPLQVLPTLAAIFGINEAIAIQQIHWVVCIKHEHHDDRTFYQDFMWCKYTLHQWREKMPWISESSIYRLFKKLENEGIVRTVQPYASSRDQTKWYRIDYEVFNVKSQIPSSQNDEIRSSQNDEIRSSQNDEIRSSQNDEMINRSKDLKDLKKRQGKEFSQNLENLTPEKTSEDFAFKDPLEDQDPTPPIAPHPPAPIFDDPMGDRFRDAGKRTRQVEAWLKNTEFLKFMQPIMKRSEYYKNSTNINDVRDYIRKAKINTPEKLVFYESLCDRYQDFLEAQARSSQQQPQAIELVASPPPAHLREKFRAS